MVCCLFFNFTGLFDFGCCSLAQEMTLVECYLPYFKQWLITFLLSASLPFQTLFTNSSHGDQLLASPPFSGVLSASRHPLLCVSFQFIVYHSVFFCFVLFCGEWSVCLGGLCWFIPEVAGK
jgi:hypothetical protein